MEIKVNLNENNDWSYYIQYNNLDFSPGVLNIFAYMRVSTQIQANFGSSINTQKQLLEEECNRIQYDEDNDPIRYNLVRIYADNGISAKNIHDRYALVHLMNYIDSISNGRSHDKIGFMVSDISRLTRSSFDLEKLFLWINDNSLKLKFIDTSLDITSTSGTLILKMLTSFFEFERKNASFKTKMTMRSMSEQGILTGHCSYGWTHGLDKHGRKTNVRVESEQEGLNEIIKISRENPDLTACEIKTLMNQTDILYLRNLNNGLWTTQVVEKILEHERFDERQRIYQEKRQNTDIMRKDEITIQLIKEYLEETDGYSKEKFNYSEIARSIDNKYFFQKELTRNYIKKMMIVAKIIKPTPKETKNKIVQNEEEILDRIRRIIEDKKIIGYTILTEKIQEYNIPLIGQRKKWTVKNVRDLCIKHNIDVFQI